MSQDLWSKLEGQFEEQVAKPVEIPDTTSVGPEKPSIKEGLAASYLNGFIPTVLVCALGFYLTGIVEGHESGLGAEIVLLLPLAWLLRPFLFKGNKPNNAFLLWAPFVLGGFTEVFGVGTHLFGRWVKSDLKNYDEYQLIQTLQDHIEGFLSFSHFGLYLLAGVLLITSYRWIEKSYYWLDLRPTNRVRVGLARLLTLALPALGLVIWACALWQHPWAAREQTWLAEMRDVTAAMPAGSFEVYEPNPKLPREESLLLERETLELLPGLLTDPQASKEVVSETKKLMENMSEYPDNLEDPYRWALAALQLYLTHDSYTPYNIRKLLIENSLPHIAEAPLSELEKDTSPWDLETTVAAFQDLKPADYGIHKYLIRQMGWQTLMEKPEFVELDTRPIELRPMNIFGQTFHTTPLKVYARWDNRPLLSWWLDFKTSHQFDTRAELLKLLRQEKDKPSTTEFHLTGGAVVYQEIDRRRAGELLNLALLIIELRKDHQSTGVWNNDVQGLELDKKRVRFDSKTGELHYSQRPSRPRSTITWKLQ